MKFISTKGDSKPVSFSEAVLKGLAPDGGLYVPDKWPRLDDEFINNIHQKSLQEIGFEVSRLFVDELDDNSLREVIDGAMNFDAPLVSIEDRTHILELFHGPTLAFKDFGARFMSRIFSAFREDKEQDIVILAATSGDTGSAVAQGFLGVEGIKVCLLYPSGKVSRLQEQQLTTAGQNVTALEVNGTFDDCQKMVKQAFSDAELNRQLILSSANSINIARLVPQSFYYLYALKQLGESVGAPIFCVPSGNFGNLTAGLMAHKIGMPATGFIAATNVNDVVPEYLETGSFNPRPSERTISNAMDVGNPSNFSRIEYLFGNNHETIQKHIWGASFSDEQTRQAIQEVKKETGYLLDPHTAVGYLAVKKYRKNAAGYFSESGETPFVILSTAHPAKFGDVIEPATGEEVPIPDRLAESLKKEKQSIKLENDFGHLKQLLMQRY
ncbi:threonine synthase [Aliifodinibius sp. S!AR15-10]|uniref:threonine synthase n=1 Tax=Aliifodinibius sp. S!AR15-10 TaxID=2950437 RepID=UPI00285C13E1|nr:threonine synthase [Aliifodinibius sp. S!AR15-10]MDR8392163.1 threonine synthase [Aliifodinibius sp. S!AR15-10]